MLNWLPKELQQLAILPIEQSINHALRYAPSTLAALEPFQGQLLAVHINSLGSCYVRFIPEGLNISHENLAEPQASMSGSLSDFLLLAQAENKANSLINSAIEISGDSDLPIKLARIVETLDIDWEALISPATGGLLAHSIGKGFRFLSKLGQQQQHNLAINSKQYAEDERQWLAGQHDIEHFSAAVDSIKLATDRLQARLERLIATSTPKE